MSYDPIKIKAIRPIRDHVLVRDMSFGEREVFGTKIVLLADDGKSGGIRPRWGKVFAVGPDQNDIREGQWIMVGHGRWTRGLTIELNGEKVTIRRVDNKEIMLVSDEEPIGVEAIGDH